MSYKHLAIKDREMLLFLKAKGLTIRAIALHMHRSPSTTSRELKRCPQEYSPSKAEQDYHLKRSKYHQPLLLDIHVRLRRIIAHYILDLHWSPEQITLRFKREGFWCVSYNTIYRHIYQNNLGQAYHSHGDTSIQRHLRHKHRTRHAKNTRRHREPHTNYIPIQKRPAFINNRSRISDWEIDTVLGKTGHSVLLTVVDQYSRMTLVKKIERKESAYVNDGF